MRLSVYIRCRTLSPSGYYRILQYLKSIEGEYKVRNLIPYTFYKLYLKRNNRSSITHLFLSIIAYIIISFRSFFYLLSDYLSSPDFVIISREINPKFAMLPNIILLNKIAKKTKIIWDFDDQIIESKEISRCEFDTLSRISKYIIVTNNYLKNIVALEYSEKVILLPTTDGDMQHIDLSFIQKERCNSFKDSIKLIWVATAVNIPNLLRILSVLDEYSYELMIETGKQLYITVVSSEQVCYSARHLNICNVEWTAQRAQDEMIKAHIGIMPLIDNEYTRGKGGFKLIQYMSVGLPVIASDVGFNKEVVKSTFGFLVDDHFAISDWVKAIKLIIHNMETYDQMGKAAYAHWNEHFSFSKNLIVWRNILKSDY